LTLIWGIHAVEAALANPNRQVRRLWLTENANHRLRPLLAAREDMIEPVRPAELDRRLGADTVHQGALVETAPLADVSLADLVADGQPIVVLDQVTDPHNVGAVLRSSAAFGAAGLVMTRRNSPPLGGALAKAASGALELVPVALVQNLARAISELKEHGVLCLGLEGSGQDLFENIAIELAGRQVAIILGAEGKGLRQLTRENCHHVCRLTTSGTLASLNVSNAAAVALHHLAWRRHLSSQVSRDRLE
jgi:23S rRNA (guanosine2251-2'-O)-methyltransferase